MNFFTKYNRPPKQFERGGGEILVERAGYISAQMRIENLILAGLRLQQYRDEHYDFTGEEIDDNFIDPTRRKSYDWAEAFQQSLELAEKMKAQREAKKKKKPVDKPEEGEKAPEEGEKAPE